MAGPNPAASFANNCLLARLSPNAECGSSSSVIGTTGSSRRPAGRHQRPRPATPRGSIGLDPRPEAAGTAR